MSANSMFVTAVIVVPGRKAVLVNVPPPSETRSSCAKAGAGKPAHNTTK
jgi:hypothetical protein